MFSRLIIIAPYPKEDNIRDGMQIRVKAIDNLLIDVERLYLNISIRHKRKIVSQHNSLVKEMVLNPIFHFYDILKLIKGAKNIYAHSIYAFKLIPYALFFVSKSNKNLILDAHGVVPEEFCFENKWVLGNYLNFIERQLFKRVSHCISVSNNMARHFIDKYRDLNTEWSNYIYYIYNSNLNDVDLEICSKLRERYNITDTSCVLIYSGNLQKWQNIDKMLDKLSSIKNSEIIVIVLTGELSKFKDLIDSRNLSSQIFLASVSPSELSNYYSISHYGFILRDDIIVNRVANPTKMLEYLTFGLVPIVISPEIGDYNSLGYEYLVIDKLGANITQTKSSINIRIAETIIENNKKFDLKKIIAWK